MICFWENSGVLLVCDEAGLFLDGHIFFQQLFIYQMFLRRNKTSIEQVINLLLKYEQYISR